MEYCAMCGAVLNLETRTEKTVSTGFAPHRNPPLGFQEVAFCPDCAVRQENRAVRMRWASVAALGLIVTLVLLGLVLLFSRLWLNG